MRTLEKDLKHGKITLKMESPEDLWHLERLLQPGDLVESRTMRKVSVKQAGELKLSEKKPMTLTIRLEKTGFDETSGTLRLAGKITEGPEETKLASYHTLQIEPGTILTVQKARWSSYQLDRIEESRRRQPGILICVLDREEADIALLLDSGMKNLGHIECSDPENREPYHADILRFISGQHGWERAVIAGPGFEAENFFTYMKCNSPGIAGKSFLDRCSHTGPSGIAEVLRRSGDRILQDTRIGRESKTVEEVLYRIKSGGLVAYGRSEVEKAVGLGAAETLLVLREKIGEFEQLMEKCEKMGGSIRVITADHQLGEQFLHLGGIAAFLRFRTEYQE